MERNRLFQLDRLEREGRVDVEEVEKATETAIRTVEQETDLEIDLGALIYKNGQPISRWRRAAFPAASWEKDWKQTERIVFDERDRTHQTTVYEATRLLAHKKGQRRRAGRAIR